MQYEVSPLLHISPFLKSVLVISTVLLLAGCPLFDSDDKDETEADPPTPAVAPSASFSVSAHSGKAPFTTSYNDESTDGSATITSWAWDFGDGNTSTDQNPSHTYEAAGNYTVSLTVTSSDGTDTLTQTSLIEVTPADVALTLAVVNEKGQLLSDVVVASTTVQVESFSEDDSGVLVNVRPTSSDGVLQISKPGYVDQFLYKQGVMTSTRHVVTLMERKPPIPFVGMLGGTLEGPNGTSVEIPSSAFVDANGNVELDTINAYVTPVDISDRTQLNAFPGSFYGAAAENTPEEQQDQLFSYGVVDIVFENEEGDELQLQNGQTATLKLPLFANQTVEGAPLQAGDTIPIWYLDENTGLWVFESNGTVVENPLAPNGLSLQGATTHFTSFNSDINPPGIGRGNGGGSGGGNGQSSGFCTLNVDLLDGEVNESYMYNIQYYLGGRPSSGRPREWVYDGSIISHRMVRNYPAYVRVVDKEGNSAAGAITCNTGNSDVQLNLSFGDPQPEIRYFQPGVRPVFSKNANDEWEILENTLSIGVEFVGTDTAIIESSVLDQPWIVGSGIYSEATYSINDPNPLSITARLITETEELEDTANVTFIDSQPPELGYTIAFYNSELFATVVQWSLLEGADYYYIFALGEDINAAGTQIADDWAETNTLIQIPQELSGYLRIEYENQYGRSVEFIRISDQPCLIGSEACGPS